MLAGGGGGGGRMTQREGAPCRLANGAPSPLSHWWRGGLERENDSGARSRARVGPRSPAPTHTLPPPRRPTSPAEPGEPSSS